MTGRAFPSMTAQGKFPSLDVLLDYRFFIISKGLLKSRLVFLFIMGDTYAYAGATSAGLYHAGEGVLSVCFPLLFLRWIPAGSEWSERRTVRFARLFIHGQCGTDISVPVYRIPSRSKGRLHLAVFLRLLHAAPERPHQPSGEQG